MKKNKLLTLFAAFLFLLTTNEEVKAMDTGEGDKITVETAVLEKEAVNSQNAEGAIYRIPEASDAKEILPEAPQKDSENGAEK